LRCQHWLRGNKACDSPANALWFDTETHERRIDATTVAHELSMGWGCYQRRERGDTWREPVWQRFTTVEGFWDFVESRLRPRICLYLFAHNLAFDLPVLDAFGQLPARGWTLKRACIESPPVILKWVRAGQSLIALDTLNWWRTSLSALGESIGIPKLAFPSAVALQAEWDTYCRRDVEVIRHACLRWWGFLRENNLGGFAPTLAGQSMRTFRHKFMSHRILIDDHEPALAIARSALYGGRVECFRIGTIKNTVYHYDVTSMYPAVMQGNLYPTILRGFSKLVSTRDVSVAMESFCCVAEVTLHTEVPRYPLRVDGRLCFPVGTFRTTLTSPEIAPALALGHITEVHALALYDRAPIFDEFVQWFYAHRCDAKSAGDDVGAWLYKILLNSLYGKFGQRGEHWESAGTVSDVGARSWTDVDAETGVVTRMRALGGLLQRCLRDHEARDSHPAIAAHVTAYARERLWYFLELAGRENVLYCDTDSLLVTEAGKQPLNRHVNPAALGSLKIEGIYDEVSLRGLKDYSAGDHRVVKGVSKKAIWIDDATVSQESWSSLLGLVEAGDLTAPTTKTVTKHLTRLYKKGTVSKHGRVLPFQFERQDLPTV
jgi:hypothetical protein